MRKCAFFVVAMVVAVFMVFCLTGCKDNDVSKGPSYVGNNSGNVAQDAVFTARNGVYKVESSSPVSDSFEAEFELDTTEVAVLKVKKSASEGDVYVSVDNVDYPGSMYFDTSYGDDGEEIIELADGGGKFRVRFVLSDFTGACEATLEKKGVYKKELFVSSLGYSFEYVPEKFSFRNEDGKDIFSLKDEKGESPVYFMAYMVDASSKEAELERIKAAADVVSDCIFYDGKLKGDYALFENEDSTRKMDFMFELNDGRLLVVETLEFDEMSGNATGKGFINDMISSFAYEQ